MIASPRPRNRANMLLAAILLAGLVLRLWGLGFGLPNLYHPDEDALVMPAIQMIKSGDLEPARLEYGSLHIYALAAASMVVYLADARGGFLSDPAQLAVYERGTYPAVYAHPEFFLAARLVSAVMGTAVILLAYLLARRLGSERQALAAAAFVAALPGLVVDAHFATPDTPLTFWTMLALYLLVRAYDEWETDRGWAYAAAGFVCGLAAATKYNGVLLAAPLLLAPLLRVRTLDGLLRGRVLAGPLAMVAGFLAGTPFALLDIPAFLRWAGYTLHLYNAPGAAPAGASWVWHLRYLLTTANGIVVVLGAAGLLLSLRVWGRRGLLPAAFALLYWLAVAGQARREARMWLPTAPLLAIWSALFLDYVLAWLAARRPGRIGRLLPITPLLVVLLLAVPAARHSILFGRDDVRTIAQQWVEASVPAGTPVAVDYFAPNLDPARWPVTKTFRLSEQPWSYYQEQGIRYAIISEAISDPGQMTAAQRARQDEFTAAGCLVETISGPFLSNGGMRMWVYQAPPCAAAGS
jgi:hypothetical protein